jgi:multiple sugar transport system substrate-binding protein
MICHRTSPARGTVALLFTLCLTAALGLFAGMGCDSKKDEGGGGGGASAETSKKLVIWWAEWAPSTGLQELSADFTKETGIAVEVRQIPWPSYQDQVFLNFAENPTPFDIVVGDSQWIGRGATQGLYLDLTSWLPTVVDMKTLHPAAVKYLAEYPPGSGKYFAAPAETDAVGFAYRRDWFEDAKEKEAFKARYNRDLAPPQTWDEFKQVAEFFTRPNEKKFGTALLTGRDYDSLTMGFQQVMWAWGGSWGDPATKKVVGVLDSPAGVEAAKFFRDLLAFSPPGGKKFSYAECLENFNNGSVAMSMNYFAFTPEIVRKMGDKAGFFVMPTHNGKRAVSLGGQGFSISNRVPADRQENAKKFIAWFLKKSTQEQWVKKEAGFTANVEILNSDAFKKAQPYNAAFTPSLDAMQDFWNVPVYNELLSASQQALGEILDGADPAAKLGELAKKHEGLLQQK